MKYVLNLKRSDDDPEPLTIKDNKIVPVSGHGHTYQTSVHEFEVEGQDDNKENKSVWQDDNAKQDED